MTSMRQFYKELRRRNVFKVGIAYMVLAWLLIEIASTVLPAFKAPDWILQVFIFLLVAGLPVVLFIVWAFELTPEGIKRIEDVPEHLSEHQAFDPASGNRLNVIVISVLAIALAYFIVDEIFIEPGSNIALIQTTDITHGTSRNSIAV